MNKSTPWYEDDNFWAATYRPMFTEDRLAKTAAEVDRLVDILGLEPGGRVLDLCCGFGRHALEFARRGYHVTGVDRTTQYLEAAKHAAAAEDLTVEFVQQDMRHFVRPDSFDAAINMFSSFGYFEERRDDQTVAAHLCESLKSGGRALIDLMGKEVLARKFRPTDWSEQDNGDLFIEERTIHDGWEFVTSRWILISGEQRKEFTIKLRLFSAVEASDLMRQCGFGSVEVFGSLARTPYDTSADRLIVVARK